ncbi:hypothetical protein [Paracraurococcus lichenis]|uniref:Uncharacterized protein n=1 Tax=Paracraurococcus lichenis TaxID=3064888 RepID=A0ABT9DSF2_9PROT|nr:hypothetical protein [Paracraurococcus sp. LOR1-02]MDO9706823.1 hypothetical protein [Paracraurococcus sp. LOR1-02]
MPDGFDLLTYLAGEPGPGVERPRVGDPVELRVLQGGLSIEAFSAAGQRLGRLPPTERDALTSMLPEGRTAFHGRIAALVPRPRQLGDGRIHIRVSAG